MEVHAGALREIPASGIEHELSRPTFKSHVQENTSQISSQTQPHLGHPLMKGDRFDKFAPAPRKQQ